MARDALERQQRMEHLKQAREKEQAERIRLKELGSTDPETPRSKSADYGERRTTV